MGRFLVTIAYGLVALALAVGLWRVAFPHADATTTTVAIVVVVAFGAAVWASLFRDLARGDDLSER